VSDVNCKGCDHFFDSGHSIGLCRRFPQYQNRSPNEKCGEFSAIGYAEPVPEMLALPLVEMPAKRKYTKRVLL
jgi:hypothetical protein